jgi:DnaJ-class molecular chaperone
MLYHPDINREEAQNHDCFEIINSKFTELKQNHENPYVRNIGQGEARHRKYKRLKLGGGQAYYH